MRAKTDEGHSPRGRPRDEAVDAALLEACITVLGDEGFGNLSFAKIAALANSSRTAIYRRWPHKGDMAVAAVNRLFENSLVEYKQTGDVYVDIRAVLRDAITLLSVPRNTRAIAALVAAAHHVSDNYALKNFVRARRGIVMRNLLEDGVKTGQLPKTFGVEIAIDALLGPIFYRYLVLGNPMHTSDVDDLMALCLPAPANEKTI